MAIVRTPPEGCSSLRGILRESGWRGCARRRRCELTEGERANVSRTLSTYERGVDVYLRESSPTPSAPYADFRRAVIDLLPPGARMLELGSGPGHDALFFEERGVQVHRTDGARAFVERLRAQGHSAFLLEVTADDFGGPFDIVFANAVLLHLTAAQLGDVLRKAGAAVGWEGLLALTVKEGDGEAWTTAKMGEPRFFTYWRASTLRAHLAATGWMPLSLDRVEGRLEPWLYVICRRAPL